MKITKLDQLKMGRGIQAPSHRCGTHRDHKHNPKGGKGHADRKAIRESQG